MFSTALFLSIAVAFSAVADSKLKNCSPVAVGDEWVYDYVHLEGGHFSGGNHESGHQYFQINTLRTIKVTGTFQSAGISTNPDTTLYTLSVRDSGNGFIATDSGAGTGYDTIYFDTTKSFLDTLRITPDTVISSVGIFLERSDRDIDSLLPYDNTVETGEMYKKLFIDNDSLDCYIEKIYSFDGAALQERKFCFLENLGAVYLYNINAMFCGVKRYYYTLKSYNGNTMDTSVLFSAIDAPTPILDKGISFKKDVNLPISIIEHLSGIGNSITIFDPRGRKITTVHSAGGLKALQDHLSTGQWFLKLERPNGEIIATTKILITR